MIRSVRTLAYLAALIGVAGCVPIAEPRFPQSVAAALAQHPMRHTESHNLLLYFPDGRQEEARRFLFHVEGCAVYLKRASHVHNKVADQKMIVLLPELPFNNAFVAPRLAGYDTETVVPTYDTLDEFSLEMGLPPDPAEAACHEITHAVQFQQIAGFAWFWNALFGAVYTPQLGLESWFAEGLAVYYETTLQPGTGRLAWPFWRGAFAAGYAGHRINGGDLNAFQRDFHAGNNYLVGSQFVRFLADRYGEDKLWRLIEVQARSIFFPLWVNVRFWQVYDKSLSTLLDEFADEVEAHVRPRARPAGQSVVRAVGTSARYARAPDGSEALIASDHDGPARLSVWGSDGRPRAQRNLTEVVPPRRLSIGAAVLTSGLSLTADARTLYFVSLDLNVTYQAARLYRYDIDQDLLTVAHPDLRGTGGSVSPDGRRYAFAQANGDHHDLAVLEFATGIVRVLHTEPHGAYVAHPRFSPDGTRIVASEFDRAHFHITLFDATSGSILGALPTGDGPVHDPSWVDNTHVLYLGATGTDAGFQVYVYDLIVARTDRVTDAPFLAFEPRADSHGRVRFLNREGWQWTVDEVALPQPTSSPAPTKIATPTRPPAPLPGRNEESPDASDVTPPDTTGDTAPVITAESATAPTVGAPTPKSDDTTPPSPTGTAPPVTGGEPRSDDAAPGTTSTVQSLTAQAEPPKNAEAASSSFAPAVSGVTDHPYSAFDHLFVPLLYGPTFQAVGRDTFSIGLVLSGNDRLSLHRWAIAGYYQPAGGGTPSFSVAYTNRQLAPFTAMLSAAQIEVHDVPPVPPDQPAPANPAHTLFRRDREVSLDGTRAFYGNPVDVGFALLETYRPGDPEVSVPLRRFAGPHASATFTGVESTSYTGPRRLLSARADVSVYPSAWNSEGMGFVDARTEIDAVVPLPLLRRHTLAFGLRGRDLVGLPADQNLLVVGGYTSTLIKRAANRPSVPVPDSTVLPPGLAFIEPLRGFEDYALTSDRIFIADASYRYPFIIDRGSASTLGLLPSFFARQIDFELFGSGATDARNTSHHLAFGSALTLDIALWEVPFFLQYQIARRATDDRGLVQLVTIGL